MSHVSFIVKGSVKDINHVDISYVKVIKVINGDGETTHDLGSS